MKAASAGAIDELKKDNQEGYAKAFKARAFSFSLDHGPHNDFKTEWWYFTGNLESSSGREFGYQVTIFRNNIDPDFSASRETNNWKTNQIYMGHLGLSDIKSKKFYSQELFQRSAQGLAGAQAKPLRVWLNDWSIEQKDPDKTFPVLIKAKMDDASLELELDPTKSFVLQGNKGLSQKSSEPGNASYYYSYPRMQTKGSLKIAGKSFEVNGQSWMDREWSTSALGDDQVGWDWFSLQLSDDHELMYYQLRKEEDNKELIDPYSLGSFSDPQSVKTQIKPEDISIEVLDHWTSSSTAKCYPSKWKIIIPKEELDIEINSLMNDQEHKFNYSYWEGAVSIKGKHLGKPIQGKGYVELTGY